MSDLKRVTGRPEVVADHAMTTVKGRSLWADARGRLVRNRAALASIVLLSLIALACLIGPLFTGHDYDQVYQDYVRVARQHPSYPKPEQIPGASTASRRACAPRSTG